MASNGVRNVLVIMTDQHLYTAAGFMGDPWVQTPNLDTLAAGGTVFERAYTPSPVCVPARQSLLTGRLPHAHGATGNARPMKPNERTIAHLAQEAGFATGATGKMHFIGPDQHQGFETRWDILDYYRMEPEASGDAASGMAAPGWYGRYVPGEEGSTADGPNPMTIHNGNYDGQPSPFPAERHVEAYTSGEAVRFMETHRDERWLLWCSYFKPHAPYLPPAQDWERYAAQPLPVPAVDEAQLANLPAHLQHFRASTGVDRMDAAAMRRCIAGYYGNVTFIDREIGTVLSALEALGLRDETLIIFTSDHGEMLGAHGLLAKSNFYEEAWHIPLVVSHPGHRHAPRRSGALACLTDLYPTIAESLGLPVKEGVHGHSLLPVVAGQENSGRSRVFSELHTPAGTLSGVFDGEWKLAVYTDREQLFHLPRDPEEQHDFSLERPEEVARLRALLEHDAALE